MELGLLGPFEATLDGEPIAVGGGKQRALLALLALNAGQAVSMEQLVDELWGDAVPETAPKMVQIYISQLRKVLPRSEIETRAPGYRLALDPEAVDSHRFERLLADGRRALAAGRPEEAAATLRDGISLWRGAALAEFGAEPFAHVESASGRAPDRGRSRSASRRTRAGAARRARRRAGRARRTAPPARAPARPADPRAVPQRPPGGRARRLPGGPRGARRGARDPAVRGAARARAPDPAAGRGAGRPCRASDPGRAGSVAEVAVEEPPRPAIVGRDLELGRLSEALADALAGRRRLAFVTGEAGLGKTTLVEGFLAQAGTELLVGRGRCVESRGVAEAYMPVLDALARLCRSAHGADVTALLRLHAPTWLTQLPWLVEDDEVEQLERRVFGANRERMLREMGEALDAIASYRPLVLVLEDLQWGDSSTLDLLGWLAYRDDAARLLVIGTYRETGDREEGVASVARGLGAGRRVRSSCRWRRSDAPAVAELVARRLPSSSWARTWRRGSSSGPAATRSSSRRWSTPGSPTARRSRTPSRSWSNACRTPCGRSWSGSSASSADERTVLDAASVVGGDLSAAAVAAALERPLDEVEAEPRGPRPRRWVASVRGGPRVAGRDGGGLVPLRPRAARAGRLRAPPARRRTDLHGRWRAASRRRSAIAWL